MTAEYEIVSFYVVKDVSWKRAPWTACQEPWHYHQGGGCSKGKDQVPHARQLFKKKKNWEEKECEFGNSFIHPAGHIKAGLWGKPEFPRSHFA